MLIPLIYVGPPWIKIESTDMRMLVLATTAAVVIFGTPAFAAATPSTSDQGALAAASGQLEGVRLAQANPNPPSGTTAGIDNQKSRGCERRSVTASPSSPNNGFGNCEIDTTAPGGSGGTPGKDQTQR